MSRLRAFHAARNLSSVPRMFGLVGRPEGGCLLGAHNLPLLRNAALFAALELPLSEQLTYSLVTHSLTLGRVGG